MCPDSPGSDTFLEKGLILVLILIYLLIAIGLTPSGNSTVHIYTWTIHIYTQTIHIYTQTIHIYAQQNTHLHTTKYTFTHKQSTHLHTKYTFTHNKIHIYTKSTHLYTKYTFTHRQDTFTHKQYTFTHNKIHIYTQQNTHLHTNSTHLHTNNTHLHKNNDWDFRLFSTTICWDSVSLCAATATFRIPSNLLLIKSLYHNGNYIPLNVKLKSSEFPPHNVFMYFVWVSEETAIISISTLHRLDFITKIDCVYFAVRTVSVKYNLM